MGNVGKKFLAAAIMALFICLSGCGKTEYLPCCYKSGLINATTGLPASNPVCRLQDGTLFGNCGRVEPENGTANCVPGYCGGLDAQACATKAGCAWRDGACTMPLCAGMGNQEECEDAMCTWTGTACSGGAAAMPMAICVDEVPSACINEKCKAMMCGITSFKPTPAIASQDWDPESAMDDPEGFSSKVMPTSDFAATPTTQLQNTVCTFKKMDRKLYNEVKASKGGMWVNSFRFGVGRSFSDYEAAKNFFPISDKLCSANPSGTVDRYMNYLNVRSASTGWCSARNEYYQCMENGLEFPDNQLCLAYCNDQPSQCQLMSGMRFACQENRKLYTTQADCRGECLPIADTSICGNNASNYPFLQIPTLNAPEAGPGATPFVIGTYAMKDVSDYMVDTDDARDYGSTCRLNIGFTGWKDPLSGDKCFDYYTTDANIDDDGDHFTMQGNDGDYAYCYGIYYANDGPWHYAEPGRYTDLDENCLLNPPLNPDPYLGQYFRDRRFVAPEFDENYYLKTIDWQNGIILQDEEHGGNIFALEDSSGKRVHECADSRDCYSGACDKEIYSRNAVNADGEGMTYGVCLPCTYATLAVQKVDFSGTAGGMKGSSLVGAPLLSKSCYEFNRDFGNMPNRPYAGPYTSLSADAVTKNIGTMTGQIAQMVDLATPSHLYEDNLRFNGNIDYRTSTSSIIGIQTGESSENYVCVDEWMAQNPGGWWNAEDVPSPSPRYLREKLTSFLQSNVMPILDVRGAKSRVEIKNRTFVNYTVYPPMIQTVELNRKGVYPPTMIITDYLGKGAAIFVVEDASGIGNASYDHGTMDMPNQTADSSIEDYVHRRNYAIGVGNEIARLNGAGAAVYRAYMMKKAGGDVPPLVGIAINGSATADALVGTSPMDPSSPARGVLHQFFYSDKEDNYEWRVHNAVPDKHAGRIDLFLQEWVPSCSGTGTLDERADREIEARMNFSRALLSNFSKPSIVWRFHFMGGAAGDACYTGSGANKNYSLFLSKLFDRTGDMVDSGMLGIVYDSWMTETGRGYFKSFNANTGNSTNIFAPRPSEYDSANAQGALVKTDSSHTKEQIFCDVQRESREILGLMKLTYGQKIYAGEGECACAECTALDYSNGGCSRFAQNSDDIPQLYCNDGNACQMPGDWDGQYNHYRCPETCLDKNMCWNCGNSGLASHYSICRIEMPGVPPAVYSKSYNEINDTYWEFLAGLPAKDKCCLEEIDEEGERQTYSYVKRTGGKQRSEFLQFPGRGEIGLDCGRNPDTSQLSYCDVVIPISQKEITCNMVVAEGG